MNLAQIIVSMHKAGCSAEQLAAVAADHEEMRIRRRCERAVSRALFPDISATPDIASPGSPVTNPDSGATVTGAATAAGGTTKAVARAALLMMPGLKPAARRIGARLIEHHNLGTGRCDPSVAGMARQEGLEERSVRRALAELEAAGLIQRVIHGSGRRNAYLVAWEALRGHAEAAENGAMPKPDSAATRTPETGNPDDRVRQNLRRNPDRQSGEGGTRARPPDRRQRELPLMRVMPQPQRQVAEGEADRRLWADVQNHFQAQLPAKRFADVIGAIPAAIWDHGKAAELTRRGSGLRAVLDALREPVPHAGAPPGRQGAG